MQEQIKILTSEVAKLKHRDSNKEQQYDRNSNVIRTQNHLVCKRTLNYL